MQVLVVDPFLIKANETLIWMCYAFWGLWKYYQSICIHIVGGKRQINYEFIRTDLLRGCPLIRGFSENNLYHHLYTI